MNRNKKYVLIALLNAIRAGEWLEKNVLRKDKVLALTLVVFLLLVGIFSPKAEANEASIFDGKLYAQHKVIGCYNDETLAVRKATKCVKKGDHNITIPPISHLEAFRDQGWNDRQIVNRFPIITFESGFTEWAENPHAKGYVQTLKKYNIAPNKWAQLKWMKERQDIHGKEYFAGKYGRIRGCGYYWKYKNNRENVEAGEEAVMGCFYRFHYDANKGEWYAKRALLARQIYFDYFDIK